MGDHVLTVTTGGLGDIFLATLHPDARKLGHPDEVGYFKALKEHDPETRTKVRMWCHNDQGGELFRYNPYVDEVDFHHEPPDSFTVRKAQNDPPFRLLSDRDRATLQWERPGFYLDPAEQAIAATIIAGGSFVVVHPFAGDKRRVWSFDIDAALRALCGAGVRVVLVGGSGHRAGYSWLSETVGVEHPLLTNLLNQHTARLHGFLTSQASKFIGTMSAYNGVAATFGVPSLVFAIPEAAAIIARNNLSIWPLMRSARMVYGRVPDPVRVIVDFAKG